jgi:hypothetical protein
MMLDRCGAEVDVNAIGRIGVALVFSGLTACGGSTDEKASTGGGGGTQSGCTSAPNCGSCQQCYDECICNGSSTDQCIQQCSTPTGGAGGAGGATGGTGGGSGGDTIQIQTDVRTVGIGEEVFFCQNFTNPFGGPVDVLQSESFMTPGSHHMFVFYEEGATDGPLQDCSGLEYKRTLHTAQTPQHLTKYPPGVGRYVEPESGLRVMAHYLNTGSTPIEAQVTVVFKVAPGGSVEMQAASMFFNNLGVFVNPNSTGQATKTCNVPHEARIIDIVSHMHKYGVHFKAETDQGVLVYEGTDWDEPEPAHYDPPLVIPAGSQITYTCDYDNPTSQFLTFGDSAQFNEMCILSGTYFPAPNGESITCIF